MANKLLKIFLPALIAISSLWMGHIFSYSYILGIILVVLCVTLSNKKIYISIFLLLVVFVLVFNSALDREIFVANRLEQDILQKQDHFAGEGFGKLYKNRIGLFVLNKLSLPFYKLEKNLFYGLDLNIYFFAGHPRESGESYEFEKFPFFLLPFFIIGLYLSLSGDYKKELVFILIASLLSIAFSTKFLLGPILFFPLIVNYVSKGIEVTYLKLIKKRHD